MYPSNFHIYIFKFHESTPGNEQRMQRPKGFDNNKKGEDIRNNINKKTRASEKID